MINLLTETTYMIERINKKTEDIEFIGSYDGEYHCTWEEFINLADFEYSSGYGSHEIPLDLVIVFKDKSFLHRDEYDGSEWWDYEIIPTINKNPKKIMNLISKETIGSITINSINKS